MSSWNFTAMIIGLPGDGKTTIMRALVQRHLRVPTGIVLAHDPLRQFGTDGCVWYPDVRAYRAACAAAGRDGRAMARGASIGHIDDAGLIPEGATAEDVTRLALEMGRRAGNTADDTKLRILVPFDEGSLRSGSGKTWMGDLDRQFLVLRRHRGVGPIFNLQEASQLTSEFYKYATDVFVFCLTRARAKQLDEWLHLEAGTLERAGAAELGEHRYLHVRRRVGVVSEAL